MNYDETKRSRDRDYTTQYRDWVAKLTAEERRTLAAQGLLEPVVDAMRLSKGEDVSAMPLAVPSYGLIRDEPTPTHGNWRPAMMRPRGTLYGGLLANSFAKTTRGSRWNAWRS